MNITNPTNFGIPGLTLTTANAEGTGNAVRTGASILAFDATDPAAVAADAVVGSATVSARRDHVHPGIVGAGTVVDEAIARFNGTSGASFQGYSSLSPTISDAGIISLTSGALKFPATEIDSADANTLDDYSEGTWSPRLMDTSRDAGDEGVNYGTRVARYIKIGKLVFCNFKIEWTNLGTLTTSSISYIGGLPFTSENITNNNSGGLIFGSSSLDITAGYNLTLENDYNQDFLTVNIWDVSTGITVVLLSELSVNGSLRGMFMYQAA